MDSVEKVNLLVISVLKNESRFQVLLSYKFGFVFTFYAMTWHWKRGLFFWPVGNLLTYDLKDSFYHLFFRSASSMWVNIHVSLSIRGEAQPRLQLFRSLSRTHQLCSADPITNTSKMWEARFPFPVRPQGLQHQISDGEG